MEFCPKCGRYLKDGEFQCPECGNTVREVPISEKVAPNVNMMYTGNKEGRVDWKKVFFDKYFFIALAAGLAISFAVTYLWRFTFFIFCIPLLLPLGKLSIGAGLFTGLVGGSLVAILTKMYLVDSWIA
jgi:hypothetical protein